MIVEVLAVGTELLLGQTVNTNASVIGEMLADSGMDHHFQTVVGDNEERIVAAITLALDRSDALIITGGLGPTQDDLTREAVASFLGVELRFSDEYEAHLRNMWSRRGREMPESNLRQAYYPAGAELMPNPKGSAPGLQVRTGGGQWIFAVPGVPAEMVTMVREDVLPFLQGQVGLERSVVLSRLIRSWGISESRVAELLADLFESENPTMAFLASAGEIKVRLTAKAPTELDARDLIRPLETEVRRRLGDHVFGADDDTIENVLLRLLVARGWTVATAESATGGLIAGRVTSVPGASDAFRGGIVAYSAELKEKLLGVDPLLMEEHGVVSEEVAIAMARGAAVAMGAEVTIAVTGSAGPDPQEQPPGTMVVAVATPEDARAQRLRMPGDRERVRTYTVTAALHLARLAITGKWWTADRAGIWAVRPGQD